MKNGIKTTLMKNGIKHGNDLLSVSENLDKDQSLKERSCGKVKRALCNSGIDAKDVEVNYRKGLVLLKKEKVAEWVDGKLALHGRAKDLEAEIGVLLDERSLRSSAA